MDARTGAVRAGGPVPGSDRVGKGGKACSGLAREIELAVDLGLGDGVEVVPNEGVVMSVRQRV